MVSLPEHPPTFRPPAAEETPWWWRLEDADGTEVDVSAPELTGQRFPSQADAESWVGEMYGALTEAGVDAVSLFDLERKVYGPMSLHP
ncbi:hypothetical protein [Nocardioides limicola]|uniref:hypothetical protein n=1 Tax=Nocardioides limicola TaxID=2803368 RepID=UPI00193B9EFE|nr:hypothetical protein [Nocardioides sp. DJM-14]